MVRRVRRWRHCAFGCLAGVLFLGITLAAVGFFFHRNLIDFAEGGFTELNGGTNQEITTSPEGRFLVFGNRVTVLADSDHDIIILAGSATLYNRVSGDVYFRGEHLEIADSAVIEGKLKIEAKRLVIKGEIKGPIEGKPDQLENHRTQDLRKN